MRLKNFICAVVAALFGVAMLLPASAQNLVTNGNFTSNAAGFTNWPGYVGGSNPTNIPGWTQISGPAGGYGVNGAGTVTSIFGPVNTGGNTFGFIQGTGKTLAQNLPSLAVNTSYILSFLAAARNQSGESNDVFKVQIGDGASVFVTSGNVVATNAAFQNFSYPFTTPASFSGTPSLQLSNASPAGDHTVDFTSLSVLPANVASLVVFTPASGNWNTPGNWSSGVVPLANHSPDILNGRVVTVNSSVGTCGAVYVGQGNQTPTGTILFRSGGALTAGSIFLGRDGTNFGRFTQTGGALGVSGTLNIGDAAGASGEYNLSGGTLSLTNAGSTVIVGNQGVGKMLVVGNSVLSAPNILIGNAAGAAGSKLFQWGGTIYAGNLTVGAAGVTNCAFTISSGATLWTGIFQVNNQLVVQGSQFLLQQTGSGGGLQLGAGATLEFDLDAQGVMPLQLTSSQVGINAASQLVVDGSKYVRWSGAPGSFTLVNHGGYSGATQFA